MKTVQHVPETAGFTGSITLKVLTFRERIAQLKEMGFTTQNLDNIDPEAQIKFFDKVLSMVEKVNLVYEPTKTPMTEVTDLETYREAAPLMIELFKVFVEGPSLGKPSTQI